MTTDGGGWTRILRLTTSDGYQNINSVPNAEEFVNNGSWLFSKTQLKNSNRELMYKEVNSPYRRHRYDFKQGSNLQGEDFVGAVTGDKGSVAMWEYDTSSWVISGDGQYLQTTIHNGLQPNGIRFHHKVVIGPVMVVVMCLIIGLQDMLLDTEI